MNRGLFALREVVKVQRRRYASGQQARPSMEEYGVPTEPWKQVYERNQKKWNLQLAAGIVTFGATMAVFYNSVNFGTTPWHLLKNE
uniref:Deltamethrin resistance protein prag01 domain-containing protein n=1 Tax=Acartia pacifica TaxID=335913 RepID=A0A0U2VC48_ACAPC|nr:putative hypothetical protein LOC100748697 [Acartia pacifica]